jgi:hypothetical protein
MSEIHKQAPSDPVVCPYDGCTEEFDNDIWSWVEFQGSLEGFEGEWPESTKGL